MVLNTKADELVVPVATDEVKVCAPVPVVKFIAVAPPLLPRLVIMPEPLPMVVVLLEVKVVKAPLDAEDAPIEVPSIVPPLMSIVVTEPRSAQVAPAAVGLVVIVGEVIDGPFEKTTTPLDDPVSSESAAARAVDARAEVERLLEPSVVTNREAVKPEKFIVPEEVNPVKPDATPADVISQIEESMATDPEPPPIETAPVELPVLIFVAKLEEALSAIVPPVKSIASVDVTLVMVPAADMKGEVAPVAQVPQAGALVPWDKRH